MQKRYYVHDNFGVNRAFTDWFCTLKINGEADVNGPYLLPFLGDN